jgi:hypothetical protein
MTADRRMTLIAAAACAATSLMVHPLFVGWQWLAVAAGAVIAVAAAGSVTRLRAMPVLACLTGSLAGLLLYLNLVFEARHSLLLLIPTPASVERLWALAGTGVGDAAKCAHPAPDLPGLLLLTAGGVGITAVLADLIAVRLRSAALAGLPLLVLFTVPAMIDPPHSRLGGALACGLAMAGYLAMLSEDGRERIRGWGRPISVRRAGTRPPRGAGDKPTARRFRGRERGPGSWAAAGWRAGLIAIVLAFGAPLLAPSLHLSSLLSSDPGPGVIAAAFAPPDESHPTAVFTYTTSASPNLESNDAQYFRQYIFDTLSDTGWQMSDYAAGAAQASSIAAPPGLSDLSSSVPVKTTVTVGRDFSGPGREPAFLPLPSPATAVSARGKWLADADLMVYSTSDSIAGQTYSVQSLAVDPAPAQLAALPGLPESAALAPDIELPSSYETAALKNVAQQHADRQSTEFGQVNALAHWLSGPRFSYSEHAAPFDNAAGLLSFLTNTRSGFCVHYAYAMTVLTRLLGIPARMVTGFTAGTRLPNGRYVVTSSDAHAWTEVFFPTLGWIRFEPTPGGGGSANAPNYMTSSTGPPVTASPVNAVTSVSAGAAGQPPGSSAGRPQMRRNPFGQGGAPVGSPADSSETAGNSPAALVLVVIAAVAIALIAPAAARAALRRRRWSRAADDASRAHVAWREFLDDLTDHGLGTRPSEPPRTAANRVAAGMPEPVGAAICRLAQAEERARYSVRPSCSRQLRRDSAAVRRGLAARARRGARWRARLFPASVMTALADAIVRLPSGAAGLTRRRPRHWTELRWDCVAAWPAAARPPFRAGSADGGWGDSCNLIAGWESVSPPGLSRGRERGRPIRRLPVATRNC